MSIITPPFTKIYQRIISVVPSQTELLYSLGLDKEVIAITKFCIYPDQWFNQKTRIGGTKSLNIHKIANLKPDLVIANKEENVKEQVEAISEFSDVYVSDINDLDSSMKMIESVGQLTGTTPTAQKLISDIKQNFASLEPKSVKQLVAYMIWKDPYMIAGGDTFINHMIEKCGWINALSEKKRYPEITITDIISSKCKYLLLSSEPYPFKEKHLKEFKNLLPGVRVVLVDGTFFSWYGSRLLNAPSYFHQLISQLTIKNVT